MQHNDLYFFNCKPLNQLTVINSFNEPLYRSFSLQVSLNEKKRQDWPIHPSTGKTKKQNYRKKKKCFMRTSRFITGKLSGTFSTLNTNHTGKCKWATKQLLKFTGLQQFSHALKEQNFEEVVYLRSYMTVHAVRIRQTRGRDSEAATFSYLGLRMLRQFG